MKAASKKTNAPKKKAKKTRGDSESEFESDELTDSDDDTFNEDNEGDEDDEDDEGEDEDEEDEDEEDEDADVVPPNAILKTPEELGFNDTVIRRLAKWPEMARRNFLWRAARNTPYECEVINA